MALTQEQKDALAVVKAIAAEDVEEAAGEIKGAPVYQHVFRGGFGEAEKRWRTRAEQADEKVRSAEERTRQAEERLTELMATTPDVQKLNEEWTQKLQRAKDEHAKALETAKAETEKARSAHRRALLELELLAQGLDPLYVETAIAKYESRIRTREDGTHELIEAGGETPVVLSTDETPFRRLAREIADAADPRWKISTQAGGGGDKGTNGGGSGAGDGGYDPVAAGKAMAEQQKRRAGASDLAFR